MLRWRWPVLGALLLVLPQLSRGELLAAECVFVHAPCRGTELVAKQGGRGLNGLDKSLGWLPKQSIEDGGDCETVESCDKNCKSSGLPWQRRKNVGGWSENG